MTVSAAIGVVRPVTATDLASAEALLARDTVSHCFVASRVRTAGADPWRLGGELLGYFDDRGLRSMLYYGANLVPVETDAASRSAFVDWIRPKGRRCSSFVGPAEEVLDLWRLLEPAWGPARDVRAAQPLMVLEGDPQVAPDPGVRLSTMADLDLLVPACVDMFTVEVGVSPVVGGAAAAYRARIAEIVQDGRSFVRVDDGAIVFKAEVGAVAQGVCQVQGVWVDPSRRGEGLSEPGMAAVAHGAVAAIAPTISLYVNDFNTAARKAYLAVGFRERGSFATVLF